MKRGDSVRVLKGKHKGEIFTVDMIDTGASGDTHLYLSRGNVVIFKTTKQVERVIKNG